MPWALSVGGLVAVVGLLAMPFVVKAVGYRAWPDTVRFIGHFHPVILHLPIGVFALIVFQELAGMFDRRGDNVREGSLVPLGFGAGSAVIAAIAGFLLYQGHAAEYGGNALAERHLWGGLAFAAVAVVTLIVRAWSLFLSASPWFYRLLLFTSVGVMGFASHDGASITRGSGYLTEFAPAVVRTWLGLENKGTKTDGSLKPTVATVFSGGGQRVYADMIAPIFERRCVQCHKEGKAKGKFRMDRYDLLIKGGEDGPGIDPGSAEKSNVVIRMELPKDDEDRMPPEGKTAIEDSEVVVVKWWINQGADPEKMLKDFVVPEGVQRAMHQLR